VIHPITDRDVLLGALALQLNLLTAESLAMARSMWESDRTRSLGQVLLAQGLLHEKALVALEILVESQANREGPASAPPGNQATLDTHGSPTPSADPFETRPPVGAEEASAAPGTERSRYRVLRPHARGGLGQVFVALDEELQREVALKEIQAQYADNAGSRRRFLLEAELTGRLEHPGIVPVYGLCAYADGRPFYTMRFIKGDSLKDAIGRFHADAGLKAEPGKRGLELRLLLGRFIALCNAIAYAHSKGVLHRDLKPDNVLLGRYGETVVIDWGLAKTTGASEETTPAGSVTLRPRAESDPRLTQAGSVLGTPAYMSPEQAAGRNAELGPASDVYSLGATLYHLLTGRAPFVGGDPYAILERVCRGLFPPPREVEPSIPPALEAVCLKAMARRPEDRFATAKELADDIERWLSDEPVLAYLEPLRLRLGRWRRRHPALVTGTGALLFVALVALGVGSLLLSEERGRTLKEEQEKLAEQGRARVAQHERDLAQNERNLAQINALKEEQEKLAEQGRARVAQHERDLAQNERNLAQINSLLLDPQLLPVRLPVLRDLGDKAVVLLHEELERKPGLNWMESQRDALAQRQANAAVALLRLGKTERVWPLLQSGPYPDTRTYLLHRAGPLGVEAKLLWERLEVEKDDSVRQALILALGEYTAEQLPAALRQEWTLQLSRWYREDPDAGVHAAIDWLLRHDKEGPQPRKCDWADRRWREERKGREGRKKSAEPDPPGAIDRSLWDTARPRLQKKVFPREEKEPPPEYLKGARWYVNRQGQTMVLFQSPSRVIVSEPRGDDAWHAPPANYSFALASKKVTVAEFGRFLRDHPEFDSYNRLLRGDDEDCPIVGVTWYEAAQYCRWLSERERIPEEQMYYPSIAEIEKSKDGKTPLKLPIDVRRHTGYRLPREAEWEYACRARSVTSRYYGFSEEMLRHHAWYDGNAQGRFWPVGQKKPNAFGLFDMHGNGWEWCNDFVRFDGIAPLKEVIRKKVVIRTRHGVRQGEIFPDLAPRVRAGQFLENGRAFRGSTFNSTAGSVRSAARGFRNPLEYRDLAGFRVARTHD
jgi:formylglycine-generating enzyme required for sulfatase activity/tRNA A-37 threonylcarbamoyl transferase component Bud32